MEMRLLVPYDRTIAEEIDRTATTNNKGENIMLNWAITFLIIAIIAGLLGFGGVAGAAAGIAKILAILFLVLFLASLVMGRRVV
jgi:uncharacterized membrane protein YtjA (UPF0391 family)